MNKVKIAVIDSGISSKESTLPIIGISNIINKREDTHLDLNGHGTMCVKTINFLNSSNAYYIVKCLDRNLQCSSVELLEALESLLELDADIVNLSLATSSRLYYKEFEEICGELKKQGKIIIGSVSKEQRYSIPAILPSVIGVEGMSLTGHSQVIYKAEKKIQCIADATPLIIKYENSFSVFAGHSKATACLCGIVSKELYGMTDESNVGVDKNSFFKNEDLKSEICTLREILVNEIGESYLETSKSLINCGINKGNINVILKKIENVFKVDLPQVITLENLKSEKTIIEMIIEAKSKKSKI